MRQQLSKADPAAFFLQSRGSTPCLAFPSRGAQTRTMVEHLRHLLAPSIAARTPSK